MAREGWEGADADRSIPRDWHRKCCAAGGVGPPPRWYNRRGRGCFAACGFGWRGRVARPVAWWASVQRPGASPVLVGPLAVALPSASGLPAASVSPQQETCQKRWPLAMPTNGGQQVACRLGRDEAGRGKGWALPRKERRGVPRRDRAAAFGVPTATVYGTFNHFEDLHRFPRRGVIRPSYEQFRP